MNKKVYLVLVSFIIIISFLFLTHCKKSDIVNTTDPGLGGITLSSGQYMSYAISVPDSYNSSQAVPLVIGLHWGGDAMGHLVNTQGLKRNLFNPGFAELNAIIVAPCGIETDQAWTDGIYEEALFLLVDHIKTKYNIDNNKVLIAGEERGAVASCYYSAKFPNIFTMTVAIIGSFYEEDMKTWGTTPLYLIFHDGDYVRDKYQPIIEQLKEEGKPIEVDFINVSTNTNHAFDEYVPSLQRSVSWIKSNW